MGRWRKAAESSTLGAPKAVPYHKSAHAERWPATLDIDPELRGARVLYLCLDGTDVPVHQSERGGCKEKQPDGSAKTPEAKIMTVRSRETHDKNGAS